ncbi:MAG TPA: hypothetical protein VKY65_00420 [Alphaproteobacteria bacterium]|nr:hypothetical protein [Alphaproteobacteria bacterium]
MSIKAFEASVDIADPRHAQVLTDEISALLTSQNLAMRQRGYELFEEIVKECLYQSCMNYRALLGGYRDPIKAIVMRTVEA